MRRVWCFDYFVHTSVDVYLNYKQNNFNKDTTYLEGLFERETIFVQPFFNNFIFHTHIIFVLSFSIVLVFMSIHIFLCKYIVVHVIVNQIDVQITILFRKPGGSVTNKYSRCRAKKKCTYYCRSRLRNLRKNLD